ncbi:MAG: GyrI-like domain-containing protein [Pseudomonadota bacterium]
MFDVRIELFMPRDVLFVRRHGPYAVSAPEAWKTLWGWLHAQGHAGSVKRVLGVSWDAPDHPAPDTIRYDACVEMHARVGGDPGINVAEKSLPGGAFAVLTHEGDYSTLGARMGEMVDTLLPEKALEPDWSRPAMEVYLNDPTGTDGDAPKRTDICIPIHD